LNFLREDDLDFLRCVLVLDPPRFTVNLAFFNFSCFLASKHSCLIITFGIEAHIHFGLSKPFAVSHGFEVEDEVGESGVDVEDEGGGVGRGGGVKADFLNL